MTFYKYMGEHYLKPHEDGLRSLFDSRENLLKQLHKIKNARKELE